MYSIGDFSKLTGIPASTLRFYDKEKVLVPITNEENGYRYYEDRHACKALFINNMKSLGLPLHTITELIDSTSGKELLKNIGFQMEELQKQMASLSMFEEAYLKSATTSGTAPDNLEDAPLEETLLPRCNYLFKPADFQDKNIHQVLCNFALELFNTLSDIEGLRQSSTTKIICNSLVSKKPDYYILPVDDYRLIKGREDAGVFKDHRGIRSIVRKKEQDFLEDMRTMLKKVEAAGYTPTAVPIIDFLMDPADIPGSDEYIAAFCVPIR